MQERSARNSKATAMLIDWLDHLRDDADFGQFTRQLQRQSLRSGDG
jgi:hypothetical protein